jgi:hypothetical protein
MNKTELIQAVKDGVTLVWADPEPIEGNNYTIRKVTLFDECEDEATIQYGEANTLMLSEAEVFISEIKIKDDF